MPVEMMATPEIMWECIRNNHSFLRKSTNNKDFSAEKGNLLSLNRYSQSGLANRKAIDIIPEKHGKKELITMVACSKKASRTWQPPKFHMKNGINKCTKKAMKQIDKVANFHFYRRGSKDLLEKKYLKIRTSFKKPKAKKVAKAEK